MTPQKLAEKYRALISARMPKIETAHDDTGHFYMFNGQKYPSVTKALQMLKDEGLMNWKMNKALEWIKSWVLAASEDSKQNIDSNINELIEQAKLAPTKEFEDAGDIGKIVHYIRQNWFDTMIRMEKLLDGQLMNIPEVIPPAAISGLRGVKKFVDETGYIPIACELYVASEELEIGGTLDDIGILPGEQKIPIPDIVTSNGHVLSGGYKTVYHPKLVLLDLKTSNIGTKTSYYLQIALYFHMFKKLTGINIKEFYILHVSKIDGTYKLIRIKNMPQLIRDAKTLLKLKKSLDRIDDEKKKEPIIV